MPEITTLTEDAMAWVKKTVDGAAPVPAQPEMTADDLLAYMEWLDQQEPYN